MEALSILTALGLGLLGFVEPCSLGVSLLFIQSLEMKSARDKVFHTVTFTLTRALVIGALGALAAGIGTAFFGLQKAGWIVLGAGYVILGALYLAGRSGTLKHGFGPRYGKLMNTRTSVALGVLFGLNIPACAAPLLAATLAAAAANDTGAAMPMLRGFLLLVIFGFALSLPIVVAVLLAPARRLIDGLASAGRKVPILTGAVLIGLGGWSVGIGLLSHAPS